MTTRSELVKKIVESSSYKRRDIDLAMGILFDAFGRTLSDGGRIELRDFGVLSIRQRPSRQARNPRTGESVSISAKKYLHFKMGKNLQKTINNQKI